MPSNNKYLYDDVRQDWFKIALESDLDNERTVVFVTNGKLENGMQDAHIKLNFNATVIDVEASVLKAGGEDVIIQVQKSTDYTTWEDLLANPIVIASGQHNVSIDLSSENIELNDGDALVLNVLNGSQSENLSLNLKVLKK